MALHKPTNSYSNQHININIHGTYVTTPGTLPSEMCQWQCHCLLGSKIDKHIPDDMAHHKPTNSYSNQHININIHGTYATTPGTLPSEMCQWQCHCLWESKIDKHIPDDMAHHKPTNSYSNGHINTNIHGTYMLQPLALCLQKCVSGSVIATLPKSTRLQTT